MFKMLKRREDDPRIPLVEHRPIMGTADEVDFVMSVSNFVADALADRKLFTILAGAVFALQQDMKRAEGISLWDSTNLLRPAFEKLRISLPPEGNARSRKELIRTIDLIEGVMIAHGNFAQNKSVSAAGLQADAAFLKANSILSGIQNKAAGIWFLTVMPSSDTGMVQLAATNAWLRLSMVSVSEMIEWAEMTTGRHFDGIYCQGLLTSDWPQLS